MSTNDDRRLQAMFQMIGGGGSAHEIAVAVKKIEDDLKRSGQTFRDLAVTANGESANSADDLAKRTADLMAQMERDKRVQALADERIERAQKDQWQAEIQRDVLATFVSDRVAEIAAKSAQKIIERIEAGEDVGAKFGRPAWAHNVAIRKRWRQWFSY